MPKAGYGKQKGAAFERWVCKSLSMWISNGRYDDVFWRSAMSGGRATLAKKQGKSRDAQDADISAIRKEGHILCRLYAIECKFYKDLRYLGLFSDEKTGGINEMWLKHKEAHPHKHPMLVCKQNLIDAMVILTKRGAMLLGLDLEEAVATFPSHDAYLFSFDDFLSDAVLDIKPRLFLKRR